jgi:predicted nuclease of predicted toxin-antitoxin system
MRFIIDAQLPAALARFLESRGHDAKHVFDIGLANAEDKIIWQYAIENHAIIITKDEDFVILNYLQPNKTSVVWIRIGNTSKKFLLAWFEKLLPSLEKKLSQNETLIELI